MSNWSCFGIGFALLISAIILLLLALDPDPDNPSAVAELSAGSALTYGFIIYALALRLSFGRWHWRGVLKAAASPFFAFVIICGGGLIIFLFWLLFAPKSRTTSGSPRPGMVLDPTTGYYRPVKGAAPRSLRDVS